MKQCLIDPKLGFSIDNEIISIDYVAKAYDRVKLLSQQSLYSRV